jgi:hypothetical protein
MIQAGTYSGRAIPGRTVIDQTEKGDMQVVVGLQLFTQDDPHVGDVNAFLNFSEKAAPYSEEKLKALGYTGGDVETVKLPNEVSVEVSYEMYNGKEKMKVNINTFGGAFKPRTQLDAKAKRAFLASLNATVKQPSNSFSID